MNSELEMKLQKDFPFMQCELTNVQENLYIRWGCECDNGWYNLIYELCREITKAFEERSTDTCEICGNEGCLRKDTIIKSLCDNCYMNLLNKKTKG